MATILRQPELVGWLNEYLALSVQNLVRDGAHPEGMGYSHGYMTENLSVVANVRRYFQLWPPRTPEMRTIAQSADAYHAAFARGIRAIDSVRMPDGIMAPFGNTPIRNGTKRDATRSVLLPGYGHVVLGDGAAAQQTQVNLAFNDNANHCEQDVLSFTLFGFEKELLSDLRYARMPGRPFTESTMAHNTVTVNRRDQFRSTNQDRGNRGHLFTAGDLQLYEPNLAGISVVEVDGARAYQGVVSRYQRMLVLNASDPVRPYLLDLFRVTGGQTHDYFIHGATLFDMTTPPPNRTAPAGKSTLPLALIDKPYPLLEGTETFVEPPQDQEPWYGAFRDVFSARSNGNWNVTFSAIPGPQGVRITMLDGADVDVFVGKSPSPHRDKMPPATPEAFYAYWRPSLLARHRSAGPAPLESLFVGIIEPFAAGPALSKIERLPLSAGGNTLEQIALKLSFADGREDVVLVNLGNPDVTGGSAPAVMATGDGQYTLEGRLGIASKQAGTERSILVGGARFDHTGKSLRQAPGGWSGAVSAISSLGGPCGEKAFVTDAPVPAGLAEKLKGRWLKLRLGSYKVVPNSAGTYPLDVREQTGIEQFHKIARVDRQGDRTLIVLSEDPMLTFEGGVATETTRPGRSFAGPLSFEVVLAASE